LSSKSRSKEQAEEIVAALRTRVREGKTAYIPWYENGQLFFEIPVAKVEEHKVTVSDMLDAYWQGRGQGLKAHKNTRYQLERVREALGSLVHMEITDEVLTNWILDMRKRGLKNKTIRVYFQKLQTATAYCYERKRFGGEINPDIEHYNIGGIVPKPTPRDVWFTKESFEKFYQWYSEQNPHIGFFFLEGFETGNRLQETASLRWEWVRERPVFEAPYAPRGAVWRYFQIPTDPTKTDVVDQCRISDRLWDAMITMYPRKEERTGLIFRNPEGRGGRNPDRMWKSNAWNNWKDKLQEAFPADWREGGAKDVWFRDTRRSKETNNLYDGMSREEAKTLSRHRSDSAFQMYDARDRQVVAMRAVHPEWFIPKPTESGQVGEEVPKTADLRG
jgi:hypothetical protein